MSKYIQRFKQTEDALKKFHQKSDNKKLRIRDIADHLNVSEAELLSLDINKNVKFLSINNFESFFNIILSQIDKVMFLIRTDFVVHEKIVKANEFICKKNSVLNKKDNSLLIKFNSEMFTYIFYENKKHNNRNLKSFQLFDQNGISILKIYLKGKKDVEFESIANDYKVKYDFEIQKNVSLTTKQNTSLINHDIDLFNSKPKINQKELKLSLRELLTALSEKAIPIQLYAFGIDCVQYHRDVIKNIVDYGPWLNVMDKNFNIHILENKIIKNILTEYVSKDNKRYSADFYDTNNDFVIGISVTKDFELNFIKILNGEKV